MRGVAINVAVASAVFWLLSALWHSGSLGVDALVEHLFSTVVFAMIYAAIQVGILVFRSDET